MRTNYYRLLKIIASNSRGVYEHYLTCLPDSSNYGVREYWYAPFTREHFLSEPEDTVRIIEKGIASRTGITTTDDRYIAPLAATSYYQYNAATGTYESVSGAASPGGDKQVHWLTVGYGDDLKGGSFVTSEIPGNGGYKPYTRPDTNASIPSLDMGNADTDDVILRYYLYTNVTGGEKTPLVLGVASTVYHKSNPAQPVTFDELFEFTLNEYPSSSCPAPTTELKCLGEDIFYNYDIGRFSLAKCSAPQYNYLMIRRKKNSDIAGKIRIAYLTSTLDTWTPSGDKSNSGFIRLANKEARRPATLNFTEDYGRNDYTKGFINVPIDSSHIKVNQSSTVITGGTIDKISKANDGFQITVIGTAPVSWCWIVMEVSRSVNGTSAASAGNFLKYVNYNASGAAGTTVTGVFDFINTSDSEAGYNKSVGDFASNSTYYYAPRNFATEPYTTVSFGLPIKAGNNILKLNRISNASTSGEKFTVRSMKIFCNNAEITLGAAPTEE